MGKHFWGGIVLLCVLLAATVWIGACMEQSNLAVRQMLTEAQQTAENQLDKATKLVQEAKKKWDQSEGWVSALADHTPMDQIRELFAEAELLVSGIEYATMMIAGEPVPMEIRVTGALNNILGIYGIDEETRKLKTQKVFALDYRNLGTKSLREFKKFVEKANDQAIHHLLKR